MTEDRWRKLEVWELADDLAFEIYQATRNFPKEEIYGITSQIRRAALSIPTNTCPVKQLEDKCTTPMFYGALRTIIIMWDPQKTSS